MKSRVSYLFLIFSSLLLVAPASWAQKTFIKIVANGNLITSGEASESSLANVDLADYADVISYNFQISRGFEEGISVGGVSMAPITIVKPRGPSSIYLLQALTESQAITATIIFFLPDPADPGRSIEAFQVALSGAAISSLKPWQNITPSSTAMLEAISIVFSTIEWQHPPTGGGFEYTRTTVN